NLGFGAGHNLALKKIKADYYLILNSDTLIESSTLDKMVDFMKSEEVDLASCKVVGFDRKLQPNGGDLPLGLSLLGWLFNLETFGLKSPAFHRDDSDYYKSIHEVDWISGNFMMIKNRVFEKISFFNED